MSDQLALRTDFGDELNSLAAILETGRWPDSTELRRLRARYEDTIGKFESLEPPAPLERFRSIVGDANDEMMAAFDDYITGLDGHDIDALESGAARVELADKHLGEAADELALATD